MLPPVARGAVDGRRRRGRVPTHVAGVSRRDIVSHIGCSGRVCDGKVDRA